MQERFTGLVPAVFTPFRADGGMNLGIVPALVEHHLRDGIKAIFVCGTTGESSSMSSAERRQTVEAFVKAAAGRLDVIVHVGRNALCEARELAAHAQASGAAAIAACPPSFLKPADAGQIVDCCAEIAAGAPRLPFYYYHIPSLSSASIDCLDLLRIAKEKLPQLRGLKFTFENLMDFHACLEFDSRRFDCLFGRDEILLSALVLGTRGAVGSTYNFAAPLYRRLWAAFDAGDLAQAR